MRKTLTAIALALFGLTVSAQTFLLNGVTVTGAGTGKVGNTVPYSTKTYQGTGSTASGTGTAVISVEGSNDASNWDVIGTITLTLGTTATSGSFTSYDRYTQNRGNVTTLTGTGAAITLTMGF